MNKFMNKTFQPPLSQVMCILVMGSMGWADSSVQFSRSVVSDSLRPRELQHARPPCPSPTPGVHPNSCPSSRWCHPAISSSVIPFYSCPQSLPASGSFPMRWKWGAWGGQSTGVSALASSPSKEHPGLISFRLDWLDLRAVHSYLKYTAKVLWESFLFSTSSGSPAVPQ